MNAPRTTGTGRRFELVLIRLRPPSPGTSGVIAKHASAGTYHWVLVLGGTRADPDNVARLLAVAYLDEASGVLGRGDPRWAVPRAYLRSEGRLEPTEAYRRESGEMPPAVRRELDRIARWLRREHAEYLRDLCEALRSGPPDDRFDRLAEGDAERRGFADPTGRGLLAPHPPPVVSRTPGEPATIDPAELLPWRGRASRR